MFRAPDFRDRTTERAELDRLLDAVRAGESRTLVVRGEAGMGKTALLEHFTAQASGFSLARVAGTESEMELPFSGLHQLCAPILNHLDALPDPQRNALRVTFGLMSGTAPDRFLVGLATLSLLAEAAQERPLLCIVDDAQWLDAASVQAFGFVARRLLAESVLMLFAVREPTEDHQLAGLPEVTLRGLSDLDARALLLAATPGRVDDHVRDRVVAESRGNPLALLELPKAMTPAELAGGFPLPHSRDLLGQLEDNFLRRLEALPESTQLLALVAAADPSGDVALLWRAAQTLGIERAAAAATDAEELLQIGSRVQFRHPLVRSAIYSSASSGELREVHLALAAAMDPQTDPDRRAWHRALAAAGPDEEVAAELETSAGRAQSRGGIAAAAAFMQRSAALTQDPGRRADRALAAAQAHLVAGAPDEALRLLAAADVDVQHELQRARIDLLRGKIALASGRSGEACTQLLKAAKRLEPLDVNLARETYLDAFGAAAFAGSLGMSQLREVCLAAREAPAAGDPQRLPDLLLDGLSLLITDGLATAMPTLRNAIRAFPHEELAVEKGLQWGTLAAAAATTLWDFESVQAIYDRQSELARRAGALVPLSLALSGNIFVMVHRGELDTAAELAAERDALADAVGLRHAPFSALFLEAFKGDEPRSSTFIEAAIDLVGPQGEGVAIRSMQGAAAVLALSLTRYELALPRAVQASAEASEFLIGSWVLPELVEAAARTGNEALAVDTIERLARSTSLSQTDWARGIFARCQALVSDGDTAEAHYREAVERLGRTPLRPELARAHLLYGEWLRRHNRRDDARDQLRVAYGLFTEIGMLAFAERAGRELRATGEAVRKRREAEHNDLTPQEEQIARLALEGRTNPEIGAQLFISARTVEWHLRKVFAKLGITSRRGLRDVLPVRAPNDSRN